MSKTTTRGGFRPTQKLPFNPQQAGFAGWEGKPHQTVTTCRTRLDQAKLSNSSEVTALHWHLSLVKIVFPPCLSYPNLKVSERCSTMTKIQLDYYLQAAAVPPSLGQLQCFFLLNLDRISVGFLPKTVPGYSWASACANFRRTSSYLEYLFFMSGEIIYCHTVAWHCTCCTY